MGLVERFLVCSKIDFCGEEKVGFLGGFFVVFFFLVPINLSGDVHAGRGSKSTAPLGTSVF